MPSGKTPAASFLTHGLVLAFLWWMLSHGDTGSWRIGVPAVLLAAWGSYRLDAGASLRLSITGLLHFVPFFIWESYRGGVDVARRILGRRVRIQPGFQDYRTSLPDEAERLFLMGCISLLPGTLSVQLEERLLRIHALDATIPLEQQVGQLERKVARLFSVSLPSS